MDFADELDISLHQIPLKKEIPERHFATLGSQTATEHNLYSKESAKYLTDSVKGLSISDIKARSRESEAGS